MGPEATHGATTTGEVNRLPVFQVGADGGCPIGWSIRLCIRPRMPRPTFVSSGNAKQVPRKGKDDRMRFPLLGGKQKCFIPHSLFYYSKRKKQMETPHSAESFSIPHFRLAILRVTTRRKFAWIATPKHASLSSANGAAFRSCPIAFLIRKDSHFFESILIKNS